MCAHPLALPLAVLPWRSGPGSDRPGRDTDTLLLVAYNFSKMTGRCVLFLDQITPADSPIVGPKAATLGFLRQSGIPVPCGFVIPTTIYDRYLQENGLAGLAIEVVTATPAQLASDPLSAKLGILDRGFERGQIADEVVQALREAFTAVVGETGAVVVRSSATTEDRANASFAGQQLSVLNVRRFDELLRAVRRCWASLFWLSTLRYRARCGAADRPAMAVIVQAQITCQAAGMMFTRAPMDGANRLIVEGIWGMGEALAQGEVSPDRYVVDRETLAEATRPCIGNKRCQRLPDLHGGTRLAPVPLWRRRRPVLNPAQLGGLALLGLQIERLVGAPQDVEWGLANGRWYVFQSRPITTLPPLDLDMPPGAERCEWTSAFLDERLTEPVSPLGWSILRDHLENLAFREPLQMIGVDPATLEPMTRLWNGRPYVNVAVFEALYKLFPDALLPEDARRFFPNGQVARRKRAPRPRSLLAPEVWSGLLKTFARDPLVISPFHNDRAWLAFEREYVEAMGDLARATDRLERDPAVSLNRVLWTIADVERHNRRLLQIHRWSLIYAEVSYSLLRRIAGRLLGSSRAAAYCARLVDDLDDYSVALNRALSELACLARRPADPRFPESLATFLAEHGHRSFSLDVIRPSFAADPSQVLALIQQDQPEERRHSRFEQDLRPRDLPGATIEAAVAPAALRPSPLLDWLLGPLIALTRRYARLRENQRLTWQRGIALLRRLYLLAGEVLVREGLLDQPDEIFFLTAEEIRLATLARPAERNGFRDLVAGRRGRYADSWQQTHFPRFLRGNCPLDDPTVRVDSLDDAGPVDFRGVPVSPGIGRGKARIILRPDDLDQVKPGDVLVTRGADPGWTPVFDRLAALIMETGGQLSHASVVAREYRLPAVVGVAHATRLITPGEEVIVDGSTGTVRRVHPRPAPARPRLDAPAGQRRPSPSH